MATPLVSIIIVTHNSKAVLEDCLRSLPGAATGLECEVIVVDNASLSDPTALVHACDPTAAVLRNTRNLGFAAACNQGARAAQSRHVVFLNPDLRLDPGAVERLYAALSRDVRAGVVSGRLRHPDGSFQPSCREFPTVSNMIFSRGSLLGRLLGGRARYTLPDYTEPTEVPAVAATMMMIRRDLFLRMGGFDERFFMYLEDTDLCLRLHRRGYHNYYLPGAGAVHLWACGSTTGRVRRVYYHHEAVWKYFLKHVPNGFSLVILPLLLLMNMGLVLSFGGHRKTAVPAPHADGSADATGRETE